MAGKLRFGISLDLRNPPQWHRPWQEFYAEWLELAVWCESLGFDCLLTSEHHQAEDGYLPSPLVAATAIAARTKKIGIGTAVLVLPLYHPVRLAEDCAVLDIISNGRFELGAGIGYRADEFAAYGQPLPGRGAWCNEALQIIAQLWEGETVTVHSKHFQFDKVKIMPRPIRRPRPPIWIGGFDHYAERRAARFGDGLITRGDLAAHYKGYVAELKACGRDPSQARLGGGHMYFIVAKDPEQTWHEVAPHVLHQINTYAAWSAKTTWTMFRPMDLEQLKASGRLSVLTPSDAIEAVRTLVSQAPVELYYGMFPPAGFPIRKLTEHLELFATKVIPAFR